MPNLTKNVAAMVVVAAAGACQPVALASGGAPDLAGHFGFEDPRIVVVDRGMGPTVIADMDGDGLNDIVVANNSKSRIEIYRQRQTARTAEEQERDYRVNRLPPSPWFDRSEISVAHRVTGFRVFDADADGKPDIVYAGVPGEIVVMRQAGTLTFEQAARRRVASLSASQDGFAIVDVMGDDRPEVLAIVDGKIAVFNFESGIVRGEPLNLGSDASIVAFFVEDFNGDGLNDVVGVIPDSDSPLRLWLQTRNGSGSAAKDGLIGPETRFELPKLIEAETIRFPNRPAASIGTIERASRRIVLYDIKGESVEGAGQSGIEREAPAEVFAFRGGASKERSVAVGDINGDGMADLLTTDPEANSVVLHLQARGIGLGEGRAFSAFKKPKTVAMGQWDSDPELEVFILSEEEKAIGVSQFDPETGRLSFPQPLTVQTSGASPVAMNYVKLEDGPSVAVVVRDRRDHTLEIHRPDGRVTSSKLEGISRPPQAILAGDFDHDGKEDVILFTPNEPMVMVLGLSKPSEEIKVLTDKSMPQFGLVQSAGPENTASLDIDGDGFDELLIADKNFVRACKFDPEKGWSVVEQVTMPEASSQLVGLDVLQIGGEQVLVASDRANKRLVLMGRDEDKAWEVREKLRLTGFEVGSVRAGSFAGDGQPNILALSDSSFALVRLGGQRMVLEEFAAYRSDETDRFEHEMAVGDLNGDGFVDIVVLDAREQMCQIFTLSAARKLYLATEFKVFESRLFSRGESRQFEPSKAHIVDVTGNGAKDLILEVHDRFIIYPQMVK